MQFTSTAIIALLAATRAVAVAVPAAIPDTVPELFDDPSFNATALDDPVPTGTIDNGPTLVKRDGFVRVTTWTGSGCTGGRQVNTYSGNQLVRCLVRGGNAIQIDGDGGCRVSTWSGNNCRGSSYVVPNTNNVCRNVPYASVNINCT